MEFNKHLLFNYTCVCSIFFFLMVCFQQGTARRKKKVVHRTATADDKKLQFSLKKLGVNNISGIEEVIPDKCAMLCAFDFSV